MKSEKGVTLSSLIVYVILATAIVAIFANMTASFYVNVNKFNDESEDTVAYSKFNMYFLNDIKNENTTIQDSQVSYIILSVNGETIQYTIQNNQLYRNKVKLCDNVQNGRFTVEDNLIKVYLKIGDYEKTSTYVLEK